MEEKIVYILQNFHDKEIGLAVTTKRLMRLIKDSIPTESEVKERIEKQINPRYRKKTKLRVMSYAVQAYRMTVWKLMK
jgi:hypothetical protein